MGRAIRWLKCLFGLKTRDKHQKPNSASGEFKDKKGTSFQREDAATTLLCHSPATIPPNISPSEVAWLRSYYTETKNEQNKQAIAVAVVRSRAMVENPEICRALCFTVLLPDMARLPSLQIFLPARPPSRMSFEAAELIAVVNL